MTADGPDEPTPATGGAVSPGAVEPGGLDPRIQAVIDRARPLSADKLDQIRDLLALDGGTDAVDAA